MVGCAAIGPVARIRMRCVATKVMSNYTNHIAHTQVDKFMRGNEWVKPDVPASPSTRGLRMLRGAALGKSATH